MIISLFRRRTRLQSTPRLNATGDYSRQHALSAGVNIYCILVKFTTYCILMGCRKLCTVVYFQKINRRRKS